MNIADNVQTIRATSAHCTQPRNASGLAGASRTAQVSTAMACALIFGAKPAEAALGSTARPVGIATVGAVSVLASAGGTSSAAATTSMSSEYGELTEVIVTAQKQQQRLQDVPVPVSVVTADTLVEKSQLRIQDYFMSVPGLDMTPNIASVQSLSIRGIATSSAATPTVGVMIDGVPFGSSQGFVGSIIPDLDPGDLARVEVLRGPQSALYGASNMGGLVNFVTADPSTSEVSGAVQGGTSFVENGDGAGYNVRGSMNIPLSDSLAVRASAFTREDPGYIDNPVTGEQAVNSARVSGGRVAGLWRLNESLSFKVNALYQRTTGDSSNEVFVAPGYQPLQQYLIPGTGQYTRKVQAYSGTVSAKLGTAELTSVTAYGKNEVRDYADSTGQFGAITESIFGVTGTPLVTDAAVEKFSQELRLSVPFGERFQWMLGGFFTDEDQVAAQAVPATDSATGALVDAFGLGTSTIPQSFTEYAVFTNLTYQVTDRFDIQVGGRGSWIQQDTGNAVNAGPLFGDSITPAARVKSDIYTYLVTPRFRITPDVMVYTRFASGYRAGGANTNPLVPVRQYDADSTKNYEVGVKGDFWDRRLTLDASLYYIDWSDLQLHLRTAQNLGYRSNGGAAESQGIEVSLQVRPVSGLTVSGWVAYNDAQLTESLPAGSTAFGLSGDRLPLSSRLSGNLSLEGEFAVSDWVDGFAGAGISYRSYRLSEFQRAAAIVRPELPSYAKLDLHVGFRMEDWTATLYANNVTDRRGLLVTDVEGVDPTGSPVTTASYIMPRVLGLNLLKKF